MKKQNNILQPHIGDVVQLQIGGPLMTVESEPSEGWTPCVWFDANDQLHRAKFKTALLIEAEGR